MNTIAFSSFFFVYILQMFTSLDEEIHVIVANLQMKTYVFHRREKSRHSPTLKRSRKSVHARAYECNIDFFFVFHILASYIVRLLLAIIIGEEFFFLSFFSFAAVLRNHLEQEREREGGYFLVYVVFFSFKYQLR